VSELAASHQTASSAGDLDQVFVWNLLSGTEEIIYFKDLQSRFLRASKRLGALHGVQPEDLLGLSDFDLFTPEHAAHAYADEQRIIATGVAMVNVEERETWPDRPDTWVSSTKMPLRNAQGVIIGTFGISRDITRLVQAEAVAAQQSAQVVLAHSELARVEAQLRTVLDTATDGIALYDSELRYQYVNATATRMAGTGTAPILGSSDRALGRDEAFLAVWETALLGVLRTGESCAVDFSLGAASDVRWFQSHLAAQIAPPDHQPVGVVASTRDVTELRRAQNDLAHQAVHDPLTGLANRVLLMDRLSQVLLRMERQPARIALLFVDLDRFKEINDSYGHDAGDRVLVEVASRLTAVARRADTVARLGGDEFVVLCHKLSTDQDVRMIANRVVRTLAEPFLDGNRELFVTASVGVVVTADPYVDGDALLRDADAAMYQAKERGRNHFQFFDPDLRDRAAIAHAVETDLARALERHQFRLDYQPLFSLPDQILVGVEGLIRWDHPDRGCVAPDDFIGIAESRGLIVSIGSWVLDEACRQVVEWDQLRRRPQAPLTVAVNVSGRQLRGPDFANIVKQALQRYGLAPGRLCLEITETALIEEAVCAREVLEELAALGVQIALDDFGTGYSSLAHLRQFPVDILKIDRSFVDKLDDGERERDIVAAVVAMAHVLGMTVVGEGIETTGQLSHLTDLSCDTGQGYLLARPQSPAAIADLINHQTELRSPPDRSESAKAIS
jgi:diguanylate cyclase (GGDEF)-like protein/PAS domain S-box-containing protein